MTLYFNNNNSKRRKRKFFFFFFFLFMWIRVVEHLCYVLPLLLGTRFPSFLKHPIFNRPTSMKGNTFFFFFSFSRWASQKKMTERPQVVPFRLLGCRDGLYTGVPLFFRLFAPAVFRDPSLHQEQYILVRCRSRDNTVGR